jgi:hypothetical protein
VTPDILTDDSYIDTALDATTGYVEPLLEHLLNERELILATQIARDTTRRAR